MRTNILLIDADAGSAGAPRERPCAGRRRVVWSQYTDDARTHERPIVLHADDALDLALDITSILREDPSTFSPQLGPIHAGRNIDLAINDSVFGTDIAPIVGTLAVGLFDPPSSTSSPDPPDTYKNHFRPDTIVVPDPNDDVLRAFGNDRTNFDSAYTFADLSVKATTSTRLPQLDRDDDHVLGLHGRRRDAERPRQRRRCRPRITSAGSTC